MSADDGLVLGSASSRWTALRSRLSAAAEAWASPGIAEGARLRVLRARARAAARVSAPPEDDASRLAVVEFTMAQERHALELAWVREVVALRDITPLPAVPDFVAGLVNVRGRIVSVVDLKVFFGLPRKGLPDLNRVLVIGDDAIEFGLLVDAVAGVTHVPLASLQPALPTLEGLRRDCLRGLTEDRLVVLDARRILTDPRIVVNAPAS